MLALGIIFRVILGFICLVVILGICVLLIAGVDILARIAPLEKFIKIAEKCLGFLVIIVILVTMALASYGVGDEIINFLKTL